MPDKCLFCQIARKEVPATIVLETPECIAFRDIHPQAPTHVVIVPKEHMATLNEARNAAVVGRLMIVAADIAKREGIAENGYRTVMNTNAAAGQTVFHIHLHLLGGRAMSWPPG